MRSFLRAAWRRYRALPGRAQAGVAVAVVLLVVIAAAVGGSGNKPSSTVQAGSNHGTSTTEATSSTTTSTTTQSPAPSSAPTATSSPTTAATSATTVGVASTESPGACHVTGSGLYVLPDPTCTPGETNPDVTQADIASTICVSGWTSTIRPSESYTEPLKIQQMAAYGDTGSVSTYEEDHLISLELGGSPTDPRNLWPEPGASPNPKDKVENAARRAVCDGQISLAAAQAGIAANWIALGEQLGITGATTPATTQATAATTTGAAPTPTSPPTAPAGGCAPKTSGGNCYRAGEYCPSAAQGMTGTDANGSPITCEDINGTWRWEN